MDGNNIAHVLIALVTGVFGILGWMLQTKDAKQQKEIELLFLKHDEDAKKLAELELQIAKEHYVKSELDHRFDKLEQTLKAGITSIGSKLDHLNEIILKHIQEEAKANV